jgi:Protein of unknown function (DUF3307)
MRPERKAMDTASFATSVLVGLQLKHFVADYLLQPPWILRGKGSFRRIGGYVHAGIHALGSLPVLLFSAIGFGTCLAIVAAEFVIHYLIDYAKAAWSKRSPVDVTDSAFWARHGADQLLHQLTYAAMMLAVLLHF